MKRRPTIELETATISAPLAPFEVGAYIPIAADVRIAENSLAGRNLVRLRNGLMREAATLRNGQVVNSFSRAQVWLLEQISSE